MPRSLSFALCCAALLAAPIAPALADPAPTAPAATQSGFNLDTPSETLVADTRARAILDADLPGLTAHPQYDQFKGMSLTTLAPFAPDRLTDERLGKVKADLAALK